MSDLDLLNINIDRLFEQYTINEITEIHRKIQIELDKKRQELRFMVGERYRDVITAADAIKSMQESSGSLHSHIGNINDKCHVLQNSINIKNVKPVAVDKSKNFYRSVAIQIKILISIPEYIWTCLDNGDFLKAVHLYLFAIHIHTGLELDTEHKIAERFKLLSRLRLSINSFRNRILDGIRKSLQAITIDSEEASNHLCAYMLLENQNEEAIFSKFIEFRQNSLKELLKIDITIHNIVRVQIINLINCLICTIVLLRSCFIDYGKYSDGLVQVQMQKLLSSNAEKTIKLIDLEPTLLLEYLPNLVKHFRPSFEQNDITLSKEIIQNAVATWLEWTSNILNTNLSKSLELISSVKSLQAIREEALQIELVENWTDICNDIHLSNNFTVWYYFFHSLVSERAEKLICRRIETNLELLYEKINKFFEGGNVNESLEKDLRWYIWTETIEDLSKDSNIHTGLTMKTKGYSEKTVELCKEFDQKYLELLQDVNIYLHGTQIDSNIKSDVNPELNKERKQLESHLRKETNDSIEKLVLYVENKVSSEINNSVKVTKSIMAARLFQAIPQLCSNLVKCCYYGSNIQEWERVQSNLANRTVQFWNNWLISVKITMEDIISKIMSKIHLHDELEILPRWNTIEIEEQTEDKIFKSHINIPALPSIILLTTLSKISEELSSILPHTLPKIVHTQFTEGAAELILNKYLYLSNNDSLNQNLALQFLLDVKFVTTICVKRDNKDLMKHSQTICDTLRAKIDPFDLDVFYPYLQNNVKRSVLQSQALFGCLLPVSAQLASLGTMEIKGNDSEPSIVAVSTPSDTWFPLLPVTAPVLKTLNITAIPSSTISQDSKHDTKDESELSSSTFVRSGAAALFGAMTNDWFS